MVQEQSVAARPHVDEMVALEPSAHHNQSFLGCRIHHPHQLLLHCKVPPMEREDRPSSKKKREL